MGKQKYLLGKETLSNAHSQEFGEAGAGMLAMVIVVEKVVAVAAFTATLLPRRALPSDHLLLGASEK